MKIEKVKTEELIEKYNTPLRTYVIDKEEASMYYVEILSECNLRCPLCSVGNRDAFCRDKGMMSLEEFEKIVDKISERSPNATVSPYHHCEPLLHPDIEEIIGIIKKHKLACSISTNLSMEIDIEKIIEANPDEIIVSVSGFDQSIYKKHHSNGNVELVKENIKKLAVANRKNGNRTNVNVNYHLYKDNVDSNYEKMKRFVKDNGLDFGPFWARSIDLENNIKYFREQGCSRYEGKNNVIDDIGPLRSEFYEVFDNIIYRPEDYLQGQWSDVFPDTCPTNKRCININWKGQVELCGCGYDDRLALDSYIEMDDISELYKAREKSNVCQECLKNNLPLYFHYFDTASVTKIAYERLNDSVEMSKEFMEDFGHSWCDVISFCKSKRHVYIFGNGQNGQIVRNVLEKEGIQPIGVVVSKLKLSDEKNNNAIELSNCISNERKLEDVGIVVGLSQKNWFEAQDEIKNSGIDYIYPRELNL